ncbi:hypothetical protein F442_14192 [Phytophthora nicotianae P10297]|uniref:Polycystin cation channel PKD1/PKD2 domain-containing protein n=2 Tax=Phytophthora nicotianae TaxID=4792 RepID=W2YTE3_PHYNI|nr:hypothetical protein F442_14192 [Phytophthora nicotianae P10297]
MIQTTHFIYEFVIPYNYTASQAAEILEEKGSEIPGYVVTTLKFDFKRGGYIKPSFITTPTLIDHLHSKRSRQVSTDLNKPPLRWNCNYDPQVDFSRRLVGDQCASRTRGAHILRYSFVAQLVITGTEFQQKITNLQHGNSSGDDALTTLIDSLKYVTRLSVLMRLLATAAVFIQGLRVLNTFRNHIGLKLLSHSVQKSSMLVWSVLCDLLGDFHGVRSVLFGNRVHEFSSLLISMTCVNVLFGGFDFEVIKGIHYSIAFYWSFMALETFVLLNIVLAIVIDAYSMERIKKERTKWWRCRRVIVNLFRGFVSKTVDQLPAQFCLCFKERHQVVFWDESDPRRFEAYLGIS